MIIFGNFAGIASLFVGFHLGTLHSYFFHGDFWPNLNFRLEHQIKFVLKRFMYSEVTSKGFVWNIFKN